LGPEKEGNLSTDYTDFLEKRFTAKTRRARRRRMKKEIYPRKNTKAFSVFIQARTCVMVLA
jgi:hypothetical protein